MGPSFKARSIQPEAAFQANPAQPLPIVCQALTVFPWIATMIVTASFLGVGLDGLRRTGHPTSLPALWKLGMGTVDPRLFVGVSLPHSGSPGLILNIVLANTLQVVVSFHDLVYNSLFTSMHMAYEFSSYAITRKSLRVTWPRGQQRMTYWLQLP